MPAVQSGHLYIVATPIGNPADITLRALEILRESAAVVCEEYREGSTLLKKLGILEKDLITLNEHNEKEQIQAILVHLAEGKALALISDCGTPVFADPGSRLIREVSLAGFRTVPVPGPSSLMAALSILDQRLDQFIFGGFLSRIPAQREAELKTLRGYHLPVILMDTPYRLGNLLDEVANVFGKDLPVTLACDLTLPTEQIFRGSITEIRQKVQKRKAEFILVLHPPRKASTGRA